jgi:hypothetical protein
MTEHIHRRRWEDPALTNGTGVTLCFSDTAMPPLPEERKTEKLLQKKKKKQAEAKRQAQEAAEAEPVDEHSDADDRQAEDDQMPDVERDAAAKQLPLSSEQQQVVRGQSAVKRRQRRMEIRVNMPKRTGVDSRTFRQNMSEELHGLPAHDDEGTLALVDQELALRGLDDARGNNPLVNREAKMAVDILKQVFEGKAAADILSAACAHFVAMGSRLGMHTSNLTYDERRSAIVAQYAPPNAGAQKGAALHKKIKGQNLAMAAATENSFFRSNFETNGGDIRGSLTELTRLAQTYWDALKINKDALGEFYEQRVRSELF